MANKERDQFQEDLNLLRYEVKNALISMKRHWMLCLSSVTTIFLCLSLMAVFILIGIHVNSFSQGLARDLAIHVVLDEDITKPEQIEQLRHALEETDNVSYVQFSDRDAELELMIAEKGSAFSAYRGEDNPLSNAFFIYLQDQELIDQTTADLLQIDGVSSAVYGGRSVSDLANLLGIIQNASIFFIVLLSGLSLYLIYSTIKTSIASRQAEISIMKTVGATTTFIQRPFEIEGVLLGLLGALIPSALLSIIYPAVYNALGGKLFISAFQLAAPGTVFLWICLLLLLIGALMGFLASFIAVNRMLKTTR